MPEHMKLAGVETDPSSLKVDFYSPFKVNKNMLLVSRLIGLASTVFWMILIAQLDMGTPFPMYVYMTNWGNAAATLYYFLVVALTLFFKQRGNTIHTVSPLIRFIHILFQITVGSLFVICFMFWGFLLPHVNKILAGNDKYWTIMFLITGTHLIVPLQIWLESYLNQVGFHTRDALVYIPIVGVVYCILNYYWTHSYGIPVYDPLDWKSISTPIFLACAFGFAGFGFYIAKKLWHWKTGPSKPLKTKKQ